MEDKTDFSKRRTSIDQPDDAESNNLQIEPFDKNEKKFTGDSELQHAAGDYEPIYEEDVILSFDNPERELVEPSEDEQQHLEIEEEVERADEIEEFRASYGAYDPDRN
ncbi:hypothetical protein FITA111629_13570 [Filibacter tadaridae]|uniref:Uncharacterized protein n=1 Tax=Filibacter tadaridae TaxID=2483811 RepID=A0A3P5XAZ1_9BACL|nr:hypothetical protein [Filibacter tadaridae]VDC24644.1 hypothetical protein FILTAD_01057 [Filibacter tadaridae]